MGLVNKDRLVRVLGYFGGADSRYLDGIHSAIDVINDCKEVEEIPVFYIKRYIAKYNLDEAEKTFADNLLEDWEMERRKWLYYAVDPAEEGAETGDSDSVV